MARYRLTIEYDGTNFAGWQKQDDALTIQSRITFAVHQFCGEIVTVNGAGRTDAGVHATGQVAHIDLKHTWPSDTVRDAVNNHLRPDPISILNVCKVTEKFDARFSATKRHYLYRIENRRAPLTLDQLRAWQVAVPLNAKHMHNAAQSLVGHHDFTTFRSSHCQAKSPVKTLDAITVIQRDNIIIVTTSARSFMHRQVRSIVGSLKLVGEGKWSQDEIAERLAACDRAACGVVAPSHGLYLSQVDY